MMALQRFGIRCLSRGVIVVLVTSLAFAGEIQAATPAQATGSTSASKIDFAREIRPIFNQHCLACHGGVKRAAGVSYIVRERALAPAKSGMAPIVPGDPEHSELIRRVTAKPDDERMPPPEHGAALSVAEIAKLREWIRQGAEWKEHWAYVAPRPAPLPAVTNQAWCRLPMDHLVLARLESEGLAPASPADPGQWLRRVTLDLTGLPPTAEGVAAFLRDCEEGRGDAGEDKKTRKQENTNDGTTRLFSRLPVFLSSSPVYERAVNRLLDSPAFGERWAAVWVDLSRYADTQGYERDYGRIAWPYRDWLIRAFNADLPFDEFTVRQLAGDLLPEPTLDDLLATTFNRNTQTNVEGGSDDEEFRVVAVLDRVNTTWEVWQGVTFRCTQCHSHPYDPIDHEDYYRFAAFFNTSRDWDLPNELPVARIPASHDDFSRARELDRRLEEQRADERRQIEVVTRQTASSWQPLKPGGAVSTKATHLEVRSDGLFHEVVTVGTVSHDSQFTIDIPIPESVSRLTALRLEALPKDPAAALRTPELGVVVSSLRAQLFLPGARIPAAASGDAPAAREDATAAGAGSGMKALRFVHAFGDESEPFYDPEDSLNPNKVGWDAMPRIDRRRQVVFVAEEPIALPAGSTIRLVLAFESAPTDQGAQVMNRGRFSLSEREEWTRVIHDPGFAARRARLAALARERGTIPSVNVPVMKEQDAALARQTAVFIRGNWLDKGAVVAPGVPRLFPPLPAGAPTNRLTLARWLVSPENPLAARVAVNRFWEQLFGLGLVETLEDFGSSGTEPSNQALLDHLALRFQGELHWSVKKLLRELVLSATYCQDSSVRPELGERDPRNRLLARGPRNRLTAEMVRDQALAVAGLLSPKMYGPPVMPPQPDGIWRSAYNSARWVNSAGEDRYRRALYTYCKRTSGYPSFMTFDAPSREVCTVRRVPSNTPLQALVTLNDPVYIECARALATRMSADGSGEPVQQITTGWQLALGRSPSKADLGSLLGLYRRSLASFERNGERAKQLGETPSQAALAVAANAILNLDSVLTK